MKKTNKIIISLSSIISISSMPLIAASCENKNPTDEIIINNTTPPQTIDNQMQENPSGSGNSSSNTNPQTQDSQNPQEDNSKEKEQKDDPSGSGNSSQDADPQTQDNQNHKNSSGSGNSSQDADSQTQDNQNHQENKSKEEEQEENPEDLLKKLDEIKKEYEKAKEKDENLLKESRYFDKLRIWFENAVQKSRSKWNYYLAFKSQVDKKVKDEGWFKTVKDFIQEYETEIERDLKEKSLIK